MLTKEGTPKFPPSLIINTIGDMKPGDERFVKADALTVTKDGYGIIDLRASTFMNQPPDVPTLIIRAEGHDTFSVLAWPATSRIFSPCNTDLLDVNSTTHGMITDYKGFKHEGKA